MNYLTIILILSLLAAPGAVPKVNIVPIDFLGGYGPGKMNARNFHKYFGKSIREPQALVGGALLKVDKSMGELYLYIFCDPPLNRMVIFQEERTCGERRPAGVREYGRYILTTYDSAGYTLPNLAKPALDADGVLIAPVDVTVSSGDDYYDPAKDFIFVVDQENHRIAKLRYDVVLDSLVWVGSFGSDSLRFPTAIGIVNYGDKEPANDNIYVTDTERHAVIRFSADGGWETRWNGNGSSWYGFSYPSGIAITLDSGQYHSIYVTELQKSGVYKLISSPNKPLFEQRQIDLQYRPYGVPIPGLGIDAWGNIYVINKMRQSIISLSVGPHTWYDSFDTTTLGISGLCYPASIKINGDEMIICENWSDSTGIASFKIIPDSSMGETGFAPKRSHLYFACPPQFSDQTKISFDVATPGRIQILIADKSSRTMRTILDTSVPAGNHAVIWNARDDNGDLVEPGLYFCKMISAEYEASKQVLYIR